MARFTLLWIRVQNLRERLNQKNFHGFMVKLDPRVRPGPKPKPLNPKPYTLHLKPEILNPHPLTP